MSIIEPGKMDLTLVACYGEKPPAMSAIIHAVQKKIRESLPPDSFCAYEPQQVHATIIGLEGRRLGDQVINTAYVERRHEARAMNLARVLHTVKTSCAIPFSIKVTGYKEGEAYPFTSRNLHPYLRCFCIQGEIAVVMGWPCEGDHYPKLLDELRRSMQFANVLHKYHSSQDDIDNDFFFTIGRISPEKISNIFLQQLCGTIRSLLSSMNTTSIEISRNCLRVVAYVDPKLPLTTSYAYTLDEAEAKLDEIRSLYREVAA